MRNKEKNLKIFGGGKDVEGLEKGEIISINKINYDLKNKKKL